MKQDYSFNEHISLILIGIISGAISGLFFALYSDLRGQFTSLGSLFLSITFVLSIYFVLLSVLTYPLIKRLRRK